MSTTPDNEDGDRIAAGIAPRVLIVDADPALAGLMAEWLSAEGCEVATGTADVPGPFDLILVDVPFPRQGSPGSLGRIMDAHPQTPVVALSSMFFAGVGGSSAVARALGVASVLPMPIDRNALVAVVRRLSTR